MVPSHFPSPCLGNAAPSVRAGRPALRPQPGAGTGTSGAGTGTPGAVPRLPVPYQGATTAQAGAEQEPGERELSNEWALSGGFHLFCFEFLTISVCRACRWSQLAWHGEGTCPAVSVCCRADTAQAHPLHPQMHLPETIPVPSPGHCPPIWHQPLVSVSNARPSHATPWPWPPTPAACLPGEQPPCQHSTASPVLWWARGAQPRPHSLPRV